MKTDQRIKKIVVAAIKRKSIQTEAWNNTRLWDEGKVEVVSRLFESCDFDESELPILYSFIDYSNWTLFATKAVHFSDRRHYNKLILSEIKNFKLGNFKGYETQLVEHLVLEAVDNQLYKCLYETGKQSMGSVYAIQTLLQII